MCHWARVENKYTSHLAKLRFTTRIVPRVALLMVLAPCGSKKHKVTLIPVSFFIFSSILFLHFLTAQPFTYPLALAAWWPCMRRPTPPPPPPQRLRTGQQPCSSPNVITTWSMAVAARRAQTHTHTWIHVEASNQLPRPSRSNSVPTAIVHPHEPGGPFWNRPESTKVGARWSFFSSTSPMRF
jgi:hypothetical protein